MELVGKFNLYYSFDLEQVVLINILDNSIVKELGIFNNHLVMGMDLKEFITLALFVNLESTIMKLNLQVLFSSIVTS